MIKHDTVNLDVKAQRQDEMKKGCRTSGILQNVTSYVAVNTCYSSRKGKKDPEAGLSPPEFQRAGLTS